MMSCLNKAPVDEIPPEYAPLFEASYIEYGLASPNHKVRAHLAWAAAIEAIRAIAVLVGAVTEAVAAARGESVAQALEAMTDEQRIDAFRPYCRFCGSDEGGHCFCMRDD